VLLLASLGLLQDLLISILTPVLQHREDSGEEERIVKSLCPSQTYLQEDVIHLPVWLLFFCLKVAMGPTVSHSGNLQSKRFSPDVLPWPIYCLKGPFIPQLTNKTKYISVASAAQSTRKIQL
jgi:hypothetical protein